MGPLLYALCWGGVVAHKFLVYAQGPLVIGLELKGLGPGLDNFCTQMFLTKRFRIAEEAF